MTGGAGEGQGGNTPTFQSPTSEDKEDMPPAYDETRGLTAGEVPEVKIAPSETKIDMKGEKEVDQGFQGLTKEELMKYANDPFWVRLRWFLFILFWIIWVAMLVASVVIIVYAPKCPSPAPKEWWQKSPIYKVDLDTFPDKASSASSSKLQDLTDSLDYLVSAGVGTVYLATGGTEDFPGGSSEYGSREDWEALVGGMKERYQHLVIDFPASEKFGYWLDNGVDGFMVIDSSPETVSSSVKEVLKNRTDDSGSPKVLMDLTALSPLSPHLPFDSPAPSTPLTASGLMSAILDNQDTDLAWQGLHLPSTLYGSDLVDPLTMVKMLLPVTPLYQAGEELGLQALDWQAVAAQKNASASHLKLFSSLANKLRHQESVLFGEVNTNTTFLMGPEEEVFGMTRVKKGNPGYLLLINLGEPDSELTVNLSNVTHVPESVRVMARSTPISVLTENTGVEVKTFKSEAVTVKGKEGIVFSFVPNFDD